MSFPLDMAVHMVLKNDSFYLPMALESILPFVKGVFIQDQMSNDGSYETAVDYAKRTRKIYIERVDTGCGERFNPNYDEPKFRSLCVMGAESVFKPTWCLKTDADEIFTEYFFDQIAEILPNADFEAIRVNGDRFVSRTHRALHGSTPLEGIENAPDGSRFIDPHTQVWRANQGYYYAKNPAMEDFFHPILTPTPTPQLWLPGICNIHLHRLFGPKSVKFWHEGNTDYGVDEVIDDSKPLYPPTSCPKWFNHEINMGNAEKVDFHWPQYVLDRWEKWEGGIW